MKEGKSLVQPFLMCRLGFSPRPRSPRLMGLNFSSLRRFDLATKYTKYWEWYTTPFWSVSESLTRRCVACIARASGHVLYSIRSIQEQYKRTVADVSGSKNAGHRNTR